MKKILFILPSLAVGGLERVQVSLANALTKEGYDVTIMTLYPNDELRSELSEKVHYLYKPPKRHLGERIPYIRHMLYDDGMWETRATAKQLYDYYVGNDVYDIEIAFFRGLPIKIISGSTNHQAKHIAWVHSDPLKASGYTACFQSGKEVLEAYRSFDKVVCVSKQVANGFCHAIGEINTMQTIYNLIPVSDIIKKSNKNIDRKISKSQLHIVLVGHYIDTTKGQGRLISAVCRLRNEGADISLALIGSGKDEKLFHDMICKNDAESYITLVDGGHNPYPYIKEADLLVCASYFEGYNLTVAEALILGVPVLSTDCTGPNEILDYGKYGMIVENSEDGIYKGLSRLVDDRNILNRYKQKTVQRMSFFNEDTIMRQITDLFL